MPEKNFEELKQALMSQQASRNAPVSVDVKEMREQLKEFRDRNNRSRQKRAFTVESLMSSYNL